MNISRMLNKAIEANIGPHARYTYQVETAPDGAVLLSWSICGGRGEKKAERAHENFLDELHEILVTHSVSLYAAPGLENEDCLIVQPCTPYPKALLTEMAA